VFLTARRFIKICRWIELGESASEACRRELVAYCTFRFRVVQFPAFARRLKRAEEVRESLLKEFHMANVKQHAPKNLLASLWWLERRFPSEFALKNVARPEPAEAEVEDPIPAEVLASHRRLLLELAREDQPPEPLDTATSLCNKAP
jgi:ADP-ribose pyrophosphatase YjhB (NUDIX family)